MSMKEHDLVTELCVIYVGAYESTVLHDCEQDKHAFGRPKCPSLTNFRRGPSLPGRHPHPS